MTAKPERTLLCPKCALYTKQVLEIYPGGSRWTCGCGGFSHAYTKDEMLELVAKKLFGLCQTKQVDIPPNIQVYIKNHIDPAEEVEVTRGAVETHVQVTGQLPEVGRPLFGTTLCGAIPGIALPYGEVVRVTGKETGHGERN